MYKSTQNTFLPYALAFASNASAPPSIIPTTSAAISLLGVGGCAGEPGACRCFCLRSGGSSALLTVLYGYCRGGSKKNLGISFATTNGPIRRTLQGREGTARSGTGRLACSSSAAMRRRSRGRPYDLWKLLRAVVGWTAEQTDRD